MSTIHHNIDINKIINTKKQACQQKSKSIYNKLQKSLEAINNYLLILMSSSSSSQLTISFNGGKDSIAAFLSIKYFFYLKDKQDKQNKQEQPKNKSLHIEMLSLLNTYDNFIDFINSGLSYRINKAYVKFLIFMSNDIFNEEIDYIISILKLEDLPYLIIYSSSFKDGLLYSTQQEDIKHIVMGVRHDDNRNTMSNTSNESFIRKSDCGYPEFMRIYPIFEFDYYDIWGLIILINYPYPILYDVGYSSVGRKSVTFKNQLLLYSDGVQYLPAFCLEDIYSEREYRG